MSRVVSRVLRSIAPLLACAAVPLLAQQQASPPAAPAGIRRPVPTADYDKWETLGTGTLSPDGKWVAYDVRRGPRGRELRFRALASDSERTVPGGSGPVFASTSRWLLYTINTDTAALERGRGRGGRGASGDAAGGASAASRVKMGIADLRSGTTIVLEDVELFVPSGDGSHVAMRRYASEGRRGRGADLVVRNLDAGTEVMFGNVAGFAWSDEGALLAMTIDVDGKTGNGVQLLDATTGALRSLDAGDVLYTNLHWREHARDLVAFRSRADSTFADTSYSVLAWRGVGTARPTKQTYDFGADSAFPRGMRVASYRAPQWSGDGSTLFFGIAPREPKMPRAERRGSEPEPAQVEVWHWKDLREYHAQAVQGAQDRQRTHLVAWHLGPNRLVRLADDSLDTVQLSEHGKVALASDDRPYFADVISGRQYRDVYLVHLATGARDRIITKSPSAARVSLNGRYVLYAQGGHWWTYDIAARTRTNLTGAIKASFVNAEDDHPVADRQPYGVAGWTTGDRSVLLYDRFDLWQMNPDGSRAERLTRGAEDSTVYRYVALDADVKAIDPAKPLMLSATGEWSKRSGYARLTLGQPVQRLVWLDRSVSRLLKAKSADVFLFQQQSYEESPNFFVGSGALRDAKQVSRTNAFQSGYAWGKQVLMDYTNAHGDTLQMMLTYPADYQPGTKYPMVVYYYEKLSQGFHQYIAPTERSPYNITVFSQNGYFVLRPDVVFRAREPGYSGLDCVTSAVKAALATGMIDPARVGNMGHSWGGYQSAFYAVHGHGMFAATIAGAPLTDLVSMYGYTSGNTGAPETGHFETGQERMQVPLWEDPAAYIRNSTVFATDSLETPLLLEEGDADGNVNYWQSVELYNFARRLGKHVVMLVYNGENHNVARPESQIDYQRRQLEWFGHYLKGQPAPEWMTKGETYLARQKTLRDAAAASEVGAPSVAAPVTPAGPGRARGGGNP